MFLLYINCWRAKCIMKKFSFLLSSKIFFKLNEVCPSNPVDISLYKHIKNWMKTCFNIFCLYSINWTKILPNAKVYNFSNIFEIILSLTQVTNHFCNFNLKFYIQRMLIISSNYNSLFCNENWKKFFQNSFIFDAYHINCQNCNKLNYSNFVIL